MSNEFVKPSRGGRWPLLLLGLWLGNRERALQVLLFVLVPMLKPAIISVVVFQFIWTMNDFMGPLIYLSSVEKYPVSLALKMSIGATEEVEWASVIAISVVALIPSVVVFLAAQRYFIEGANSSGVKG